MLPLFLALFVVAANAADISSRIVNGEVARPHDYPTQLSLQRSGSHICGAVLVRNNYAITAAHCVSAGSTYTVTCGAHDLSLNSESSRQTRTVSQVVIHPGYATTQNPAFPNDIAVLRLSSAVSLNAQCQLANLPSGSNDFANQAAMITGWGRILGGGALAEQLKEGSVTVLSHATCSNNQNFGSAVNANFHICVKDLGSTNFGACNGDSGGPVHVSGMVVGLASFVRSGCLTNYPSAYVRISFYRSWIDSTISQIG